MKNRRASFVISIVILTLGMTVGFILLSLVYDGPVWVKFVVFVVYLLIISLVLSSSKRFIEALKDSERK